MSKCEKLWVKPGLTRKMAEIYEKKRKETIEKNAEKMRALGIRPLTNSLFGMVPVHKRTSVNRKKKVCEDDDDYIMPEGDDMLSSSSEDGNNLEEDLGHCMSPGDRTYDAFGPMKQLSEHSAIAVADALVVLASGNSEMAFNGRSSHKSGKEPDNLSPMPPNVTATLDKSSMTTKRTRSATKAPLREGSQGLHIASVDLNEELSPNLPPQDSEEINDCHVEELQLKKKRSKTKMKSIAVDDAKRVEVEFNSTGQPIGDESVSLSSFLGPLVREIVPFTIEDWRYISKETKEVLWASIQQRYKLHKGYQKEYAFKEMGCLWRASKCRLVGQIRKTPNEKERLKLKPDNIPSIKDWKAFIKKKTSKEFTEKSNKFKKMRSGQLPHTCSRKGYARLANEMKKINKSTSRIDVWTRAHIKKNGEATNAAVADKIEELKKATPDEPSSSTINFREDALSKVFGPDRNGRVRGVGAGVTPSKLDVLLQKDNIITQMQQKIDHMGDKMNMMEKLIHLLAKNKVEGQTIEKDLELEPDITIASPPRQVPKCGDKCKLLDWTGTREVVAEGRWSTSDPTQLVHHIPLGPNAVRVWIDIVRLPNSFLWRPSSDIASLEDALGTTIAWPADHVILS